MRNSTLAWLRLWFTPTQRRYSLIKTMTTNSHVAWVWVFRVPTWFCLIMNEEVVVLSQKKTPAADRTVGREGAGLTTDPIYCSLKECTFFILGGFFFFFYDSDMLCNCAFFCLTNVSSLQMSVPSAAFKVGSYTISHVGSAIQETKKEPLFLCARQEELYSGLIRSS